MIAWTGVIWSGVAGYRSDDERGGKFGRVCRGCRAREGVRWEKGQRSLTGGFIISQGVGLVFLYLGRMLFGLGGVCGGSVQKGVRVD